MKGELPLSGWGLCGQRVEQFGRSEALFPGLHDDLPFFDHVHEFDPDQCVLGCLEQFESEHRPCDPFDGSLVLFYHIMQVFDLTDSDVRAMLGVVAFDGRFIGVASVNRHRFGETVPADGLLQEA